MLTERLTRGLLLTLYQSSLVLGIVLLPFAILANRLGLTLPVHRLVEATDRAYRTTR